MCIGCNIINADYEQLVEIFASGSGVTGKILAYTRIIKAYRCLYYSACVGASKKPPIVYLA